VLCSKDLMAVRRDWIVESCRLGIRMRFCVRVWVERRRRGVTVRNCDIVRDEIFVIDREES